MNERNPALAGLLLFVGCFATSVGLFFVWEDSGRFALVGLTLVFLGTMMFSLATLNALPEGPGQARAATRILGVALSAVTVGFAVAAIVAEAL